MAVSLGCCCWTDGSVPFLIRYWRAPACTCGPRSCIMLCISACTNLQPFAVVFFCLTVLLCSPVSFRSAPQARCSSSFAIRRGGHRRCRLQETFAPSTRGTRGHPGIVPQLGTSLSRMAETFRTHLGYLARQGEVCHGPRNVTTRVAARTHPPLHLCTAIHLHHSLHADVPSSHAAFLAAFFGRAGRMEER
jgi:hypothetical protein